MSRAEQEIVCPNAANLIPSQHPIFDFDYFLDVIEWRGLRVAMLIVPLLWLGEKVGNAAVATHLADFAPRPSRRRERSNGIEIGLSKLRL
ncbi:MAG: hypothetical protein ABSG65_03465 [Bryobacteraceae bacterium]